MQYNESNLRPIRQESEIQKNEWTKRLTFEERLTIIEELIRP